MLPNDYTKIKRQAFEIHHDILLDIIHNVPKGITDVVHLGIDVLKAQKLNRMLDGFYKEKFNSEDIQFKVSNFGDKESLLNLIDQVISSNGKKSNILAGVLIRRAIDNGKIDHHSVILIEILKELNDFDIHNLFLLYSFNGTFKEFDDEYNSPTMMVSKAKFDRTGINDVTASATSYKYRFSKIGIEIYALINKYLLLQGVG